VEQADHWDGDIHGVQIFVREPDLAGDQQVTCKIGLASLGYAPACKKLALSAPVYA
jgi:hypothetical protein